MIRTAKTENGMVKGLPAADPRITAFKGIPFAAPPVGENRWRAPQPAKNWEGVRSCFEFGPISVQDTPGLGTDLYCREWHVDSEIPMSEDCLYLNVWTPAKKADERLPVLIWYFGGGFQWGYTSEMEFDGERLARRGLVVVSVNYRLAALGFLAHPDLTAESPAAPANFGTLDQKAGLDWVIRNIAAFGGDPQKITLAGQSAGGASVLSQITCEENYKKLSGAVIFSGMIRNPYVEDKFIAPRDLATAEKNGQDFIKFLGVSSIKEARKLDAIFIRDKYAEYVASHPRFGLCIDGQFCKGDPYSRFANGEHAPIPVISGNTEDEFPGFIPAESEDELVKKSGEIFGGLAEKFLSFQQARQKPGPNQYAPASVIEASVKGAFAQNVEKKTGCGKGYYYYRFSPDIPGDDNPGTFHSVDLWFFFETLAKCHRPFVGRHYDLARQMCNYFANFVKTGNPNGNDADGSPMPEWKPYSAAQRNEMDFTRNGARPGTDTSDFMQFLSDFIRKVIAQR